MGFGVRIGLEDNFCYDRKRTRKATHCELIERLLSINRAREKRSMMPAELRSILKLKPGGGVYGTED